MGTYPAVVFDLILGGHRESPSDLYDSRRPRIVRAALRNPRPQLVGEDTVGILSAVGVSICSSKQAGTLTGRHLGPTALGQFTLTAIFSIVRSTVNAVAAM